MQKVSNQAHTKAPSGQIRVDAKCTQENQQSLLRDKLKISAISNDFIAKKTCPSNDFLVVFGQVRMRDRKRAERTRVGPSLRGGCWLDVCGCGAGFCGRGVGADKNFNPPRTLVYVVMLVFVTGDTVQ